MAEPFLVLGAMKAGTTTLHALLSDHPQVDLVTAKEAASFLSAETAAEAAHMTQTSSSIIAGEVSTVYMQQPLLVPDVEMVAGLLPDVKLVAILRDPVQRALSHYRHWRQLGRETDVSAARAIVTAESAYVAFSSYSRQLSPWLATFGSARIHCVRLEDYAEHPERTLGALWAFLGVEARGAVDGVGRVENTARRRVVATGLAGRVAHSRRYRDLVRPLLPQAARRSLATVVGGGRNRVEAPDLLADDRERFLDLISDDMSRLRHTWPQLHWDARPAVREVG